MLPNIYHGDYRLLALAPLILMAVAIFFIPSIEMGVDFQGGTLVTLSVDGQIDAELLQTQLRDEGLNAEVKAFDTAVGNMIEIEVPQSEDIIKAEELKDLFNELLPKVSQLEVAAYQNSSYEQEYRTNKAELDGIADELFELAEVKRSEMNISTSNDLQKRFDDSYTKIYQLYQQSISGPIDKYVKYNSISVQTVSPTLTAHFIDKVIGVIIFSAILSVILVFLFFRSLIPSLAVLTGAFCDIIIALGAMGLIGIPLTLPSFAALLMLVGFSLDTDILLTTRMLKRKGDPKENAYDAMKTGLTMSVTGIIAFSALFIQ